MYDTIRPDREIREAKEQSNVSIAMGTYNGARYLQAQLDSIGNQTLLPLELVVSDDASEDETCEIVERFALNAEFPVHLIRQKSNLGFADNFLTAADLCKGKYVAFCDQDDIWLETKIALATASINLTGCVLYIHRSAKMFSDGTLHGVLDLRLPYPGLYRPCKIDAFGRGFGHCMVFDRTLLRTGGRETRPRQPGREVKIAHDHWIMQLGSLLGTVLITDDVLVSYRQHDANLFGAGAAHEVSAKSYRSPDIEKYESMANLYSSTADYISWMPASLFGEVGKHALRQLSLRSKRASRRADSYMSMSFLGRMRAAADAFQVGLLIESVSLTELLRSTVKDVVFGVGGRGRNRR